MKKIWLALALAAALGGCRRESVEIPVEFSARPFDAEKARQVVETDRARLGDWQPRGEQLEFIENLKLFNNQAAAGGEANELMAKLVTQAAHLYQKEGAENLQKLSLWLVERFEGALRALAQKCDAECARALCQGKPVAAELSPLAAECTSWCSDFVLHACRAGLLNPADKGLEISAEAAFLLRVAFKVRLYSLMPEAAQAMELLLGPQEKKGYYLWVAEKSKVATFERKLEAVRQLKKLDPEYPEALARGVMHYQAGYFDTAVADFEFVLKESPADARVRSWLEQAKKRRDGPKAP